MTTKRPSSYKRKNKKQAKRPKLPPLYTPRGQVTYLEEETATTAAPLWNRTPQAVQMEKFNPEPEHKQLIMFRREF